MSGEATFRARGTNKNRRQNKSNEGLIFDTTHFGAELMCYSPAMNLTGGIGDTIITPTFQLGDENALIDLQYLGVKNGQAKRNIGKNPFSPIQENENTSCFYEYASAVGAKSNQAGDSMLSDQPWGYYSNSKFKKQKTIDESKYSTHDPSLNPLSSPQTALQSMKNLKDQFKSNERSTESAMRSVSKTDTSIGSKFSKTGTGKKKKIKKNTCQKTLKF